MKRLEEISKNKEECNLVREILDNVEYSVFCDTGVPILFITNNVVIDNRHNGDYTHQYIQQLICRLIEEDYLKFHESKDVNGLNRICLSENYVKEKLV